MLHEGPASQQRKQSEAAAADLYKIRFVAMVGKISKMVQHLVKKQSTSDLFNLSVVHLRGGGDP